MRPYRRVLVVLVSIFLIFSVVASPVSAVGSGTVLFDYTWCPGTMSIRERAVSTGENYYSHKFVRDLTNSWAKVTNYTFSKSVSINGTISSGVSATVTNNVTASLGISLSITQTYAIALNIWANKNMNSKLAFYSDFRRQNFYYTQTVSGAQPLSYFGNVEYPVPEETYIEVRYKQ